MRFVRVLLLLLLLFGSFGSFVSAAGLAEPPLGTVDMMPGKVFNIGPDVNTSTSTTTVVTDGVETTRVRVPARSFAWVEFPPTKVVSFRYWGAGSGYVMDVYFYDAAGKLLRKFDGSMAIWNGKLNEVNLDGVAKIAFENLFDTNSDSYAVYLNEVEVYKGDDVPPGEVSGLSTEYLPGGSAEVSWTNPTDTDFIGVEVYDGEQLVATIPAPGNTYSFGVLTEEKRYVFRTIDSSKNRSVGVAYVVRPPPDVPTVSLVASRVEHDRVILSFGGSNIERYELYRDGVLIRSIPATFKSHTDFSVDPEATYTYELIGYNVSGSASASVTVTTPAAPEVPPPPPPTPLPTPPPGTGLPLPDPDTGNEDLDNTLFDIGDALEWLKNGALIVIFWAIVIAVIIFGIRWIFVRFKLFMALSSGGTASAGAAGKGSSNGKSGSGREGAARSGAVRGRVVKGGGAAKGGAARTGESHKTYSYAGKTYRVFEGNVDQRAQNALKKFQ